MDDIFDVFFSLIDFLRVTNWTFWAFGSLWHIPLYALIVFPASCTLIWYVVHLIWDYTSY